MERLEKALVEIVARAVPSDEMDEIFGKENRHSGMVTTHANHLIALAAYGPRPATNGPRRNIPFDALCYRLSAERIYVMQVYAILTGMFMGYPDEIEGSTALYLVRKWRKEAKNNDFFALY